MIDLNLKFVYQSLTKEEKQDILSLWISSGVLSKEQAYKRIEEVSTLILNNNKIVGVSTVYPQYFIRSDSIFFFFRMFIQQEFRGSNSIRKKLMQLNYSELKKRFENKAYGLVVELENKKLDNLGKNTNYMTKRGYTYYGKSPRGLQLWYVMFDEPKGIFNIK
ncbi:hypothetical protein LPB137_04390 [Poseidonibacter parvus]|uniref:N-acetyltransferase domain-containing protein n=1 Tax=Poseidonibacter parvus TaxID=1850254 RepID=A0A1P8KKR1_9BACT|nr:hypothetical protein [Poseidonibacter parvus]APW65131.1 hypothetical protein LPB137_04390 [Poseidonibacter parvus]